MQRTQDELQKALDAYTTARDTLKHLEDGGRIETLHTPEGQGSIFDDPGFIEAFKKSLRAHKKETSLRLRDLIAKEEEEYPEWMTKCMNEPIVTPKSDYRRYGRWDASSGLGGEEERGDGEDDRR